MTKSWNNWGNHPFVVSLLTLIAIISLIFTVLTYFNKKESLPTNNSVGVESKLENSMFEKEELYKNPIHESWIEDNDLYRTALNNPKTDPFDLAKISLDHVGSERLYDQLRMFPGKERHKTQREYDRSLYDAYLREEWRLRLEMDSLQYIKLNKLEYFNRHNYGQRYEALPKILETLLKEKKELEGVYPTLWEEGQGLPVRRVIVNAGDS
jgi:hypothetical protein